MEELGDSAGIMIDEALGCLRGYSELMKIVEIPDNRILEVVGTPMSCNSSKENTRKYITDVTPTL